MTARYASRIAGLLLCALLAVAAFAQNLVKVPPLTAHVTDLTGTLTSDQIASLDQKLSAFEERKGSQIAVLIVPTTQPEDIAQMVLDLLAMPPRSLPSRVEMRPSKPQKK